MDFRIQELWKKCLILYNILIWNKLMINRFKWLSLWNFSKVLQPASITSLLETGGTHQMFSNPSPFGPVKITLLEFKIS